MTDIAMELAGDRSRCGWRRSERARLCCASCERMQEPRLCGADLVVAIFLNHHSLLLSASLLNSICPASPLSAWWPSVSFTGTL